MGFDLKPTLVQELLDKQSHGKQYFWHSPESDLLLQCSSFPYLFRTRFSSDGTESGNEPSVKQRTMSKRGWRNTTYNSHSQRIIHITIQLTSRQNFQTNCQRGNLSSKNKIHAGIDAMSPLANTAWCYLRYITEIMSLRVYWYLDFEACCVKSFLRNTGNFTAPTSNTEGGKTEG